MKVISKLDHSLLSNKINEPECWNAVYACTEPDEAFEVFTSTFQKRLSEATANKTIKLNKKQAFKQPWMKTREKFRSSAFNILSIKRYMKSISNSEMQSHLKLEKQNLSIFNASMAIVKENQNNKWCFMDQSRY